MWKALRSASSHRWTFSSTAPSRRENKLANRTAAFEGPMSFERPVERIGSADRHHQFAPGDKVEELRQPRP